ncbi:substrate-binding domain-containing protein [Candidatus Poriferisocius sp.]|uniref:substrate-binding domain-containing protein n=1 Tax=Candidatus Poriferisocius sp. TaxID=3101276 RepID=UPI00137F56AE|nr:substrate-binding domain-containing protein [Acidimicrobiia bacterium]MYE73576.1 substrate-binding domain-containing protein [Acidimicrobiia bacterium]MYJ62323.1 substrate-binding domain-containing protein [Acidimicrobiia bacterium]
MRKLWKLFALLLAFTLVAAACGNDDDDSSEPAPSAPTEAAAPATEAPAPTEAVEVDPTQGCDHTYHVITHGDSGTFWSVVEVAVRDAAAAIGCDVVYFGSNNDALRQAQEIEAAIAAGSSGIAISLADPAGVQSAAEAVVAAGIPLYTLNSGVNNYKALGATTHIGQTETVAGNGAGERFNALGATHVLCARQEQTNVALEERCNGLAETFNGQVTSEFVGLDATPDEQQNNIAARLQGDPTIDAVLGVGPNLPLRALAAGEQAGRELIIGGFDLSSDLIDQIEQGNVAFTVDQQQYLQGYLPVILMHLQATNLNTAGGGLPILTGPGFVDTANAADVKALVSQGTR